MSHFATLVLLRPDRAGSQGEIETGVAESMAPYDENIIVPEYEQDCYCIGIQAKRDAREKAKAQCGPLAELRKVFWKDRPEGELDEDQSKAWDAHLAEYNRVEAEAFKAHPLKDKPDPTCGFYGDGDQKGQRYEDGSGCGGTGKERSTYNPLSKWDWWTIGGRWSGALAAAVEGREFLHDPDCPASMQELEQDGNILPVSKLLDGEKSLFAPFAIVTPDGDVLPEQRWREKGNMGWWAIVTDEQADWPEQAVKILAAHQDCIAVLCDLHI